LSNDDNPDNGKSRAVRARQRAIGRELRRIYDGVVNEPVPDEFLDLLRKMDEADGSGDGKKSS
jgi:Anti-sigma factor NepR